jgi:hypothetical protein
VIVCITIATPGAVVVRALAHVPGVEVCAEQHHLLGALASAQLGEHVRVLRLGPHLAGELEPHRHALPRLEQPHHLIGVLGGERGGGDLGRRRVVAQAARVW